MKRACCEWGVIFSAALAGTASVYLVVSLVTNQADFELSLRDRPPTQVAAHAGTLTFCDRFANREIIEYFEKGGTGFEPPGTFHAWSLPGIRWRAVAFADGDLNWSLDVSVLIVVVLSVGMTYAWWRGFRRVVRKSVAKRRAQGPPGATADDVIGSRP